MDDYPPLVEIVLKRNELLSAINKRGALGPLSRLVYPELSPVAVSDQIRQDQRSLLAFSGRSGSERAYLLLLHLVHALNLPQRGREDQEAVAARAVRAFCNLVRPSCWSAYFWNHRNNRVTLLDRDGQRFPQCMHGISEQRELPRRMLFAEGDPVLDLDEVPVPPAPATMSSTYQTREEVRKTLVVRVSWDGGRIATFLNWRNEDLETVPGVASGAALEPRDLRLAARYLGGWLGDSRIRFQRERYDLLPSPHDTLSELGRILNVDGREKCGDELADFLKRRLDAARTDMASCDLHWTDWKQVGSEVNELRFRQERQNAATRKTILRNGGLLSGEAGTIAAQAATWRTPILVRDLRELPEKHPLRLLNVDPPKRRDRVRCVLAVPMSDSEGAVRAVLTAASDTAEAMDEHSVQCAQVVLTAVGRLLEAQEQDADWRFVHSCLLKPVTPGRFTKLLDDPTADRDPEAPDRVDVEWFFRVVCEEFRRRMGADLAFIHAYDAERDVFRPRGVRISEPFRNTLAERQYERGQGKHYGPSGAMEDALVGPLLPRTNGLTWQLFRSDSRDMVCVWPTDRESRAPGEITSQYFRTILGVPIESGGAAQPEGVLWLRWAGLPGVLKAGLGRAFREAADVTASRNAPVPDELQDQVRSELAREAGTRLDGLVPVVASLLSLIMCCRPPDHD